MEEASVYNCIEIVEITIKDNEIVLLSYMYSSDYFFSMLPKPQHKFISWLLNRCIPITRPYVFKEKVIDANLFQSSEIVTFQKFECDSQKTWIEKGSSDLRLKVCGYDPSTRENLVAFLFGPFRNFHLFMIEGKTRLNSVSVVLCPHGHNQLAAYLVQLRGKFFGN